MAITRPKIVPYDQVVSNNHVEEIGTQGKKRTMLLLGGFALSILFLSDTFVTHNQFMAAYKKEQASFGWAPNQAQKNDTESQTSNNSSNHDFTNNKNTSDPSVLLLITTHMPDNHVSMLTSGCWEFSVNNSKLLQKADVLFFTCELPDPDVMKRTFPGQSVKSELYNNTGYQEGAILPMTLGIKHGWFRPYDWVIRVNLDVIIQSDEWMLETMRNDRVDAILVDCWNGRHSSPAIHSDFFAFRPSALRDTAFQQTEGKSAESMSTIEFMGLVAKNRHRWLLHAQSTRPGICRVHDYGGLSPVHHYYFEDSNDCLRYFQNRSDLHPTRIPPTSAPRPARHYRQPLNVPNDFQQRSTVLKQSRDGRAARKAFHVNT